MKVKIIKSTMNTYWYSTRIGEVYEVEEYTKDWYKVVNSGYVIGKEDAEEVIEMIIGKQEIEIGDKIRIKSSQYPWYWYKDKIGEVFKVVRFTDFNFDVTPTKIVVQRDGHSGQSLIDIQDVDLFEKGEKVETEEDSSKLNVNEAVELLQSLLDYGYDPSTQILLKHDSVRVNAFGKTFLVSNEDSLEDICKAVVKLSGAELS